MNKLIKKFSGKLNIVVALTLAVVMIGGLFAITYVLAADHDATQQASTAMATAISIVNKVADTSITTITFPEGAPSATISNPYNNVDTGTSPQVLSETASQPVVRLKNTSGGTLNVTLEITTWTNSIASMQYYNLAASGAVNINAVTAELSNANGAARTVATAIGIPTTEYKDLYLKLDLSSLAGKTGESTLTVLGETP